MFVPSGTMANQVALRLLGRPATLVVAGRRQHVVLYEMGAAGVNAGCQMLTLEDGAGHPDPATVAAVVAEQAGGALPVSAVFVENTHLRSGGVPWAPGVLDAVAATGAAVHLDGARLWNAVVALATPAEAYGVRSTTITCCLSKGLGAPVGSVLAGDADAMAEARQHRRRMGGMMRQSGVLAAAGIVALANVERLADDHARAGRLAAAVAERWPGCCDPSSVRTNVVAFTHPEPAALLAHLGDRGVLASLLAPGLVRFVTHLDVDDAGVERAVAAVRAAP